MVSFVSKIILVFLIASGAYALFISGVIFMAPLNARGSEESIFTLFFYYWGGVCLLFISYLLGSFSLALAGIKKMAWHLIYVCSGLIIVALFFRFEPKTGNEIIHVRGYMHYVAPLVAGLVGWLIVRRGRIVSFPYR
jgi:uncharacterized protein YacL